MTKEIVNEELITLIDDNGDETLFEILLTFDLEQFGKSYVVVTPQSPENDEEDELFVFAYTPDESGEAGKLDAVEDDAEWAACEEIINTFIDSMELEEDEE